MAKHHKTAKCIKKKNEAVLLGRPPKKKADNSAPTVAFSPPALNDFELEVMDAPTVAFLAPALKDFELEVTISNHEVYRPKKAPKRQRTVHCDNIINVSFYVADLPASPLLSAACEKPGDFKHGPQPSSQCVKCTFGVCVRICDWPSFPI